MRLVNVLALTNGLLVNDPFVSNFTNIISDAKAIKRGDLFIAFEKDNIKIAIENGAYGIIYDKPSKILDDEIAWIKVDDVSDALKRLLRFRLVDKELSVYKTDEVTIKLAFQIMIDPKLMIVAGDIQNIFKMLWNIENQSIILFSPQLCDEAIFTNVNIFPSLNQVKLFIKEHTLFETTFIYKDKLYERQMISPLFIKNLENLIAFLELNNIDFRLRKFTQLDNFEAIFLNNKFQIKEFGSTERVAILENNSNLFSQEVAFLQKNTTWAKSIVLIPEDFNTIDISCDNLFRYKSTKGIFSLLKKYSFNFALIFGRDKSIFEYAPVHSVQLTLDF